MQSQLALTGCNACNLFAHAVNMWETGLYAVLSCCLGTYCAMNLNITDSKHIG